MADAHGLPCLVTRRCTPDRMPARVTTAPVGHRAVLGREAMVLSAAAARMCSRPNSGWSETYRPSISRSKASLSRLSHSPSPMIGITVVLPVVGVAEAGAEQVVLADRLVALDVGVRVDGLRVHREQALAGVARASRTRRP